MTTAYAKFMLPWQPFQDVLTYFLVKVSTVFYDP